MSILSSFGPRGGYSKARVPLVPVANRLATPPHFLFRGIYTLFYLNTKCQQKPENLFISGFYLYYLNNFGVRIILSGGISSICITSISFCISV